MNGGMTRRTFSLATATGLAHLHARGVGDVRTVTGPIAVHELGVTLMHEHVVTDLRTPSERLPGDYDRDDAIRTSRPYLEELLSAGAKTLVEPTPIWIGRDARALRALSEQSGMQIVCATGIYGAAGQRFIPDFAHEESAEQLAERYLREIEQGIGRSGVRPGIIKTGVNAATPLPDVERKLVRAAALASRRSGLALASHTGPAAAAREQLKILDAVGLPPESFIWVHAQNERDQEKRRAVAAEGAWVELDGISPKSAAWHLECLKELAYAGFLDQVLISQDAGWYRPGPERGNRFRGYTFILNTFVPMLRSAGFSEAEVDRLLITNPARALAS